MHAWHRRISLKTLSPMLAPNPGRLWAGPTSGHPRVLTLRIAPWDVVCTVAILAVFLVMVTMTSWPSRLFAFTDNVCPPDACPLVPFGVSYYIYGGEGIGAAIATAKR